MIEVTKPNMESRIMALRYKKAYALLYAKLSAHVKEKVDKARTSGDILVDYYVRDFVRDVIRLAESDERI